MKKPRTTFTRDQRLILSANHNVLRCGSNTFTYTNDFKVTAVNLYYDQGLSPQEIFKQAGFDLEMIGRHKPASCLHRWLALYKQKGSVGLQADLRGVGNLGRIRPKDLTDRDKIERLQAEVAYLKVENDFLAKLRAERTE